jgi:hypothetical protein
MPVQDLKDIFRVTTLKPYEKNQRSRVPKKLPPVKSGVACPRKCMGEMMIQMPEQKHPEQPPLVRAICNKCEFRGWV